MATVHADRPGRRPHVILLRSPSTPDPYETALVAAGYEAGSEPVLTFTFPRQRALADVLASPEAFSGLIVTSPRAVEAIARLGPSDASWYEAWTRKPIYAVGPRTADEVRRWGGQPQGEKAGSGEELARVIIAAEAERAEPFLYLSGNRRRDELPMYVTRAGIAVRELVVYETHLRTDLDLTGTPPEAWLVFFSPSGVEAVQQSGLGVAFFRLAAIGPTTAAALRAVGWTPEAIAQTPSPEGVLEALQASG